MQIWAYLNDKQYKEYEQLAKSLNMTVGELTQKIALNFIANPDQQRLLKLAKAVFDFFTLIPPQRNEANSELEQLDLASLNLNFSQIKKNKT